MTMRRIYVAVSLLALSAACLAQGGTPMAASQVAAERARIAQERASIDARFHAEERACHQRFAVNDCLDSNLRWQRETLDALRRQEILLNDSERQQRAAERLQRLDDKRGQQQTDAQERASAVAREPKAPPQPAGGKLPQDAPPPRVPDTARIEQHQERMQRKVEQNALDQQRRDAQAAVAADEERRNAERVREANERKQRILERNAAQPSTAKPLPAAP